VHFIHRSLAYTLFVLIAWWWIKARNQVYSKAFNIVKHTCAALVVVQVALGVFAVLVSPHITPGKFGAFEWLALLHQLTGMLLLLCFTAAFFLLRKTPAKTS